MSHKSTSPIAAFFYGGLINAAMQERAGVRPERQVQAALCGYDITIRPYVNLHRSVGDQVFGVVMWLTHAELDILYGQLKVRYRPAAVVVESVEGSLIPALCYFADEMADGPADEQHVRMLLEPAQQLGFPDWYLRRIRSFLP